MKMKIILVSSFSLASLLIVGQLVYAEKPDNIMNMMNDNVLKKMNEAMNSPEGQKMVKACGNFMESNNNGDVK
jgi:hypothetical protein